MLNTSLFRVIPGHKVNIAELYPNDTSAADEKKSDSKDEIKELTKKWTAFRKCSTPNIDTKF